MKTIEELKQHQADQLAKLEVELAIQAEVMRLVPDLDPEGILISIHGMNRKKHATVKLWNNFRTQEKLSRALAIVRSFHESGSLIEGEHWKAGCCSTWPASINSCINNDNAVMDGSHIIEIEVAGGKGYGPDVIISAWRIIAGFLCEVEMPVSDLWRLLPRVECHYTRDGEVSSGRIDWPVESQTADKFRRWSGQYDLPSYRGSYYFADFPNFESFASQFATLIAKEYGV